MGLYDLDCLDEINKKDMCSYCFYGNYSTFHNHDYWEFFVVLDGSYTHVLNGNAKVMQKNAACLLRPNVDSHALKNAVAGTNHLNIRIRESLMRKVCNGISQKFYDDLLHQESVYIYLTDAQTHKIIDYTTLLKEYISQEKDELLMSFLLTYILEKVVSQNNFFNQNKPQWLSDLLLEINAPQNMHWTVDDVIKNCNFSHTHLLRLFKKHEGCTLVQYLTKVKMMQACNFILYSDMSMLDIALSLGYSDSSHLNRIFKKTYNITPRQYKQTRK